MIKVNLVPSDILAKAHQRQQLIQVAAVGIVVLVAIMGISVMHFVKLKKLEARLAKGAAELKRLEVIVAKVEELEKTVAAVKTRLGVITDLLKSRPLFPYFMSDFVRSVPMGVRVKSLTTAGGGSTGSPLKLNMAAEARSNEDIAEWVRKLEQTGKFSSVEMGPVTGTEGAEKVFNFTLTSVYTPAL